MVMERKARILIIDDEPAIRRIIMLALTPTHEIIEAGDGLDGYLLATTEKPDLILLDLQLPVMHGLAVLAKLKAGKETSKIPVIIVSVRGETESLIEGQRGGALDYLIKPFEIDELRRVVQRRLLL
jgi:DNA-binding response OmpR family regulator